MNTFKNETMAASTRTQFKEATIKLLTSTTIHGMPRVVKSDKIPVRIIWLLSVIISAYFCFKFVSLSLIDFNRFDVVTQTKVINAKDSEFPALTFCATSEIMQSISYQIYHVENNEIVLYQNSTLEDKFINQNNETCHRFNGANTNSSFIPKRITGAGQQNKFVIVIKNFSEDLKEQIKVYVTDNYVNSFRQFTPHNLTLKNQYRIGVTKQVDKKLDNPYNDCTNESSLYRKVNCLENCTQIEAVNKFNCSLPGYYTQGFNKSCTPYQVINISKVECEDECLMECEVTTYETTLVTKDKPENLVLHVPIIFLEVYFTDLNYLEITQTPKMSLATFISAIGGHLSLFIGFKFLTVIELGEYIIDVIYIFYSRKKKNLIKVK